MSDQNLTDSQLNSNSLILDTEIPNRLDSPASVEGGDNRFALSSYVDKPGVTAGCPYVDRPGVMAGRGTEPSISAGRECQSHVKTASLKVCISCQKSIYGSSLHCVKCSKDYHVLCIHNGHKWRGLKWEFVVHLRDPAKDRGFQYICWPCDPNILPLSNLLIKEKYMDQEFLENSVKLIFSLG